MKKKMSLPVCAARFLGSIGDKKAVEPLIDAMRDQGEAVPSMAAAALGEIGDLRAVAPLIEALKHEEISVPIFAAEALQKITNQDFGTDYEKWKAWYEKNKDK